MKFQDNPKLEECLKIAKEANALKAKAEDQYKKLLKQAESIQEKALEAFRNLREEFLKAPREDRERLIAKKCAIESEYFELASTFCEQNGHHNFPRSLSRIKPVGLSYCLICGSVREICDRYDRRYYQKGSEAVIQEAATQTSNLKLQKTAQRILELREELKRISNKLNENAKIFEEVCDLFGHDAKLMKDYPVFRFKCECCRKEMEDSEYIHSHYNAKYKGVIVPFHYGNANHSIL